MDGVKKVSSVNHANALNRPRMQKSNTLNRKFVKKPTAVRPKITANVSVTRKQPSDKNLISKQKSVKLEPISGEPIKVKRITPQTTAQAAARVVADQRRREEAAQNSVQRTQLEKVTRARMAARQASHPERMSAQEIKDRAVQQALRRVSRMEDEADQSEILQNSKLRFWQKRRFVAASAMALVSVMMLGYLVYLNLPDLSVRVAAMQTGIEKSYPSYVPGNYKLDGLVNGTDGKITMTFKNGEGKHFTLIEEKSSWDSAAVLSNYVKKNWDDYSVAKGQGLTIYIYDSKAAWVNGGVFYTIIGEDGELSANDLHDIAISL